MPSVERYDEGDEVETFRLDVPAADLTDISCYGGIAVEHGNEEGDECTDGQECDHGPVGDHPTSGCESCEAHVEEDNGNFDKGDSDVKEGERWDGGLGSKISIV